ncbi:MAG: cadmium-translocating P-type ATPase [Verrucomicrobiae bacterium]|nr:cadmium-translocating P-type ATPase [Verrucomicrobiae bacterium]
MARYVWLKVDGMSSASAAERLASSLESVPGVRQAKVEWNTGRAFVEFSNGKLPTTILQRVVEKGGWTLRDEPEAHGVDWTSQRWSFVIAIAASLLLGESLALSKFRPSAFPTALLLVGTILAAIPIFKKAWEGIRERELNAELLVGFAVIASVSIGQYFAAGEVAFIMLLGEYFEEYTIARARRSIGSLLDQAPRRARVLRGGEELDLPIEQVRAGETIVVRPGEKVPVDGVVRKGNAALHEAMITGEPVPAEKGPGAEVFAGTLCANGALEVEATRVGRDTTLEQIAHLVEEAKHHQAPIQRTCDRYAQFVLPIMILLAGLAYLWKRDFYTAITVLIVACPCALVVATPTAVVAAVARAAREGVLIKGGAYLERLGQIRAVIFDKTGTLTEGKLEVSQVKPEPDSDVELVLRLAAAAESLSEHPIGRAVVQHAKRAGLSIPRVEDFQSTPAQGVSCLVEGTRVLVGKREMLRAAGVDLAQAQPDERSAATELWVARAGKLIGRVELADTLREQAVQAVRELKEVGVARIALLSGDRREPSERLARDLGIEEVIAEVLPQEKADIVKRVGATMPVAMVGEGVNDGPALAAADVGMAMGLSGTDLAHEAAQVALMSDDLSKISYSIRLGQKTISVIRQGLTFAVLFNLMMIAAAMTNKLDVLAHALLPAETGRFGIVLAALGHQSSSLLVILNSMRLLAFRDRPRG